MTYGDVLKISLGSLRRTKLRAFLTVIGVVIGIGALVSMVSFGTGMQRNISENITRRELFTSIRVLPEKINIQELMSGKMPGAAGKALNDSVLAEIKRLPGVCYAYPEINIPARLIIGMKEYSTSIRAVPLILADYEPFKNLRWGSFFSDDTSAEIILSRYMLLQMGFSDPDSIIGRECRIITAKLDQSRLGRIFRSMDFRELRNPFAEEETSVRVRGVWEYTEFGPMPIGQAAIPMGFSRQIERLHFGSIFDILNALPFGGEGYPALYVRAHSIYDVEMLVEMIETMGCGTFTIVEQLSELKRGFLIMDAALGAVGTVALFVAALGIINTMVMSVLERYKEIGIMKAIGATDGEVRSIFFFETSIIGFAGGIFGILLGWGVTRIANAIANYFIIQQGGIAVDWFYIPWWLVAGGVFFAMAVSLLAGLYPANRAAKIDPIRALRYE